MKKPISFLITLVLLLASTNLATAETWTQKADMPTATSFHSASVVDGKIYVIGGASDWGSCLPTVEVYDPATDTWTRGLDMPMARGCYSTSVVNGKIYAIGGTLNPSPWMPISTVEAYDPGLIAPPPDFNGAGLVDIKDLLRLIESWDQDDPAVDIAPSETAWWMSSTRSLC